MTDNTITGRSAFLALLKDEGVTHLFGNPGTTELPVMHALSEHSDLTYVMAMQESLVVAMADGFSRGSGELTAANVHVAPGLGNAMGALYNAKFTGTPMILTAGQQEQGHGLREPLLYDELVPMARSLVKWAVEVTRLEDLPRIVRRAAKIAMSPPTGPVFISLPGDILNAEAGIDLLGATRVETRARPTDAVLAALADRLLAARNPVILCGDEVVRSDALEAAADFSEAYGAPVYQTSIPYGAHFLSERPAFMGALTRDQAQVRKTLAPYDLMVVVGSDVLTMSVDSEIDPKPPGMALVQIGLDDGEMGKNYATELAVRADVRETLTALVRVLRERGGGQLEEAARGRLEAIANENWSATRAKRIDQIKSEADRKPMSGDWLTYQMIEALPENAILVQEGLTTVRNTVFELYPYRDRYGFHGLASGGIGWSLPAAVGIQLANPDRPVTTIVGDGSAMYSIQALWTAAHHKLPMTYIICNNGGYRIIKQRLKSFHGDENYIGMDFEDPALDWVGLAKSLGMNAIRVEDPAEIADVLKRACSGQNGPTLIDAVVERSV
ncbi:MAG: thiamine pyrophosphate-dependent enzyme [Pseudomonadota bacterium]